MPPFKRPAKRYKRTKPPPPPIRPDRPKRKCTLMPPPALPPPRLQQPQAPPFEWPQFRYLTDSPPPPPPPPEPVKRLNRRFERVTPRHIPPWTRPQISRIGIYGNGEDELYVCESEDQTAFVTFSCYTCGEPVETFELAEHMEKVHGQVLPGRKRPDREGDQQETGNSSKIQKTATETTHTVSHPTAVDDAIQEQETTTETAQNDTESTATVINESANKFADQIKLLNSAIAIIENTNQTMTSHHQVINEEKSEEETSETTTSDETSEGATETDENGGDKQVCIRSTTNIEVADDRNDKTEVETDETDQTGGKVVVPEDEVKAIQKNGEKSTEKMREIIEQIMVKGEKVNEIPKKRQKLQGKLFSQSSPAVAQIKNELNGHEISNTTEQQLSSRELNAVVNYSNTKPQIELRIQEKVAWKPVPVSTHQIRNVPVKETQQADAAAEEIEVITIDDD